MVLLIAMAFDRYVAICKPLHYLTIMSPRMCIFILVVAWILGLIHSVAQLAFVVDLPFCGPNVLDSFYCDLPQLIKLACTKTDRLEFMVTANSGLISVGSFFILIISYIFILVTVRKHSSGGLSKALSTLSAHVTVVVLFFGPLIFFYTWPFPSSHVDKFLAILDAVLTPFLNPVIYTFRNKEMKAAMRKLFYQLEAPPTKPMDGANHSVVSEFVFLGLTNSRGIQLLLFVFSSMFYVASMTGNSLIVFTVASETQLHSPMYFLLANLSFVDLGFSSVISPKMIYYLFRKHKVISFRGCITQIFFIHLIGGVEMVLLIAMAFDRYVAICKPLHYLTIMSPWMCIFFLVAAWVVGLIHSVVQLLFVVKLPFCGPNELDSFYCDLPGFIKLACTDTYRLELMVTANSGFISVGSFFILIISYVVIILTVQKHSSAGSSKALSTLSAHITVVVLFFGPLIFFYTWPSPSTHLDKFLAFFDAVLTPFLNPVIYTLRNQEMKVAMRRICRQLEAPPTKSMDGANHSVVSEFVFLGLTNSWANLSFIDLGVSSVSSPKMIYDLFRKRKVISFRGCITQIFFIHLIGGVEMVLLIAMAFDRYVAIYTYRLELMVTANSGFISVGSFFILIISYVVIILTVQKHSSADYSKALSTLSAHITVVVLFFGPLIFFYTWPSPSTHLDKFLAFFDAVLTPFLNPVIYTLRNQEMKVAMRRICRQLVSYGKLS
ncbi:hypothetical protein GHT09_013374 [Marmota monax]|uniref:G-protein coupled receptors family 1 profile domain-containing protein n=1 Tax=Marmota monax TaxID=9995 RepID=A0A834QFE8_MARMO|nr:hypothetical protein GHT09_013374 [Marmota monax]